MKIRKLIILLTVIAVISCNSDKKKRNEKKNELVGTWRLIEYSDYDTVTTKWTQPYGDHPKGYLLIPTAA